MPWPLVPVSNDPDVDEVLTLAKLLTYKPQHLKPPAGKFSAENLSQTMETRPTPCRCFLVAMEEREYLLTLQPHRKWQNMTRNVQKSDLVLLCCKDAPRNDWPLARVTRAQADSGGMVQRGGLSDRSWRLKEAFQTTNYRNHPAEVREPMNLAGSLTFSPFIFCFSLTNNLVSSGILEYHARSVLSRHWTLYEQSFFCFVIISAWDVC